MALRITATLTTIARALRGWVHQPAAPAADDGGDYFEALAAQLLRESPAIALDTLIDRVAEASLIDDCRHGGWVVDCGLWGPGLYRREAAAAVRRLVGQTLVLEDDGGWLAVLAA